jgi:hypothetical protein
LYRNVGARVVGAIGLENDALIAVVVCGTRFPKFVASRLKSVMVTLPSAL